MFKKTLVAVAALGAVAGSAMAADLTVYGLVDYGFAYQHVDGDVPGTDAQDSFKMNSGMNSGSRVGFKGVEDLGNGVKVGFVLENGFSADTGALGNTSKLFDREAQLYIDSDFGRVAFGRVGQLTSANGTYGLMGRVSPFGGGWGDTVGAKFVFATGYNRMDNMVTYVSPEFAGFKVHAQYSFQNSSGDGVEGKSSANRYYGVAATYDAGNFSALAIVDSINYGAANYVKDSTNPEDDQLTVTLGGAYDFGVAKVFAAGQYFDNATAVGNKVAMSDGSFYGSGYTFGELGGAKGYGVALGVSAPVFGGNVKAHLGYMDAEGVNNSKATVSRWNAAVGYDYSLSARTSLYTAAAYTKDDAKDYNGVADPSSVEVMAGMIHKF